MTFDALQQQMRAYEADTAGRIPDDALVVARLDGRGFTRLLRETHPFEAPFDIRFRDLMVATAQHVMEAGFRVLLGYTQSDELSLLFHPDDRTFGRRRGKVLSVLSGEASAAFSLGLGAPACFDCRLAEFPDAAAVVDYFRWRMADASRNALTAHAYWMLRKEGLSGTAAAGRIDGLSADDKEALLTEREIVFRDVPAWQRRGVALYEETYEKHGVDPRTGKETVAERRRLRVDLDLPEGPAFGAFVRERLAGAISG